jgi:MFS family permease
MTTAAGPDLTEASLRAIQRRTVRTLAIAQVIGTLGVGVLPSVGVLLAEQVTNSEMWAGLGRTGSTLGAALGALPLAALAARKGRRVALATGWLSAAVGALLLIAAAQLDNLVALLVGLALAGVGTAAQYQARFAATDLADPAGKARALSTVVWIGSVGSVLGPNLGAPGDWLSHRLHLAPLGGAFVLAAVALLASGVVTALLLRPDPLTTALEIAEAKSGSVAPRRSTNPMSDSEPAPPADAAIGVGVDQSAADPRGVRLTLVREVIQLTRHNPVAARALVAIITAQTLMVSVMTMAPVHMSNEGGSVTIVGLTISLHIIGMYWFSPIAGMVADRAGAATGMTVGVALFAASFALAIVGASSMAGVIVSLLLLGLGWSFMSVAGSASLSSCVEGRTRPRMQGFADTSSNLGAALAAFLGGPLMAAIGYGGLSVVAWLAMAPLCLLLLRRHRSRGLSPGLS